jgi:hypothetical protein
VQLFIGLGPNGRDVDEAALRQAVSQVAEPRSVVMRPSFAIVTVDTASAQRVMDALHNTYLGNVRLSVRADRSSAPPHTGAVNSKRLYIGLGPNGSRVSLDELRTACEAFASVLSMESARFCAFVNVTEDADAQAIIDGLNGKTMSGCRLVVRYFHD